MRPSRAASDAARWGVVAALLLVLVPVGWVSPDGLHQADLARSGSWRPNPNHLLNEPLNAAWLAITDRWAPAALPVDRLRRLSGLWAALAIAAFRRLLAPRLASSRGAANYATAWFAGCAVFAILALSAETYVLQLPVLVVAAALLLRLQERVRPRDALALGATLGLAALCFVSLALLLLSALCLGFAHPGDGARAVRRRSLEVVAGFVLVTLPSFWLVWRTAGGGGFLSWLGGYGGAPELGRLAAAYGLHDASAIGGAALRALYGAVKSVVDLVRAVAQWRDEGLRAWPMLRAAVAALALWSLAGGRGRGEPRNAWTLIAFVVPPTLLFGLLWNNSDEQFYAPLAIAVGALAAQCGARSRAAVLAGALALIWNAVDLTARIVLYPRAERLAALAQLTAGSDLVIYPGYDELQALLRLDPPAARVVSLTGIATVLPPASGLERLRQDAQAVVARGGKVLVLDIYDRPPLAPPWKFLRSLDYDPPAVRAALADLPYAGPARRSGPWTVRETSSPPARVPEPGRPRRSRRRRWRRETTSAGARSQEAA
jgi:hypothetical protein